MDTGQAILAEMREQTRLLKVLVREADTRMVAGRDEPNGDTGGAYGLLRN